MAIPALNSVNSLSTLDSVKTPQDDNKNGSDFFSVLQSAIGDVNEKQIEADNALGDIATGQVKDLHQAAISLDKAEISMKVMLEVRNKAINAYKELAKTQI